MVYYMWKRYKYVNFEVDDIMVLLLLVKCKINYKVKFIENDIRVTIKLKGLENKQKLLLNAIIIKEEIYCISFIS